MSFVLIFLAGSFFLGMLLGPLSLAVLIRALSDERGRDLGDWAVGIGLKSVWRPALTFNAANELALKRRSYDETHDEQKITFGGLFSSVERFLYDPQDRLHNWFGTPFGFVDERFGIIFDPRDAAVGLELSKAQQSGTYQQRVERGQQLVESVQAVFEVPGRHAGVNLSNVWTLIGGSFDSQLVRKLHEFYQKSQAPKSDTTALRQLLVPVGAFIAVLLLGMFASGESGGSSAASQAGNETTLEYGWTLLLFAVPAISNRVQRDTIVKLVFGGLVLGLTALLYIAFPIWVPVLGIPLPLGIWAVISMAVGAAVLPVVAAWFGRSLGGLGMLLGKLFITIGLLDYERPVITLVDGKKYELREYGEHEWPAEPQFYRFALTRIGVGLANNPDVWGENVALSPSEVDAMGISQDQAVVADGGVAAPNGWTPTDVIKHEDIWGYVPEDVDDDAQYVRTDLTTGWFFEAGQNRRLMTAALESAKEEYGGGNKPVSDKWVLGSTLVAMLMGALFNWLVFF